MIRLTNTKFYKMMEYKGKLYGKVGRKYFDTGKTTEDWDKLEAYANQSKPDVSEIWIVISDTYSFEGIFELREKAQEYIDDQLHRKDYGINSLNVVKGNRLELVDVSDKCKTFEPDMSTSSATICRFCGQEKYKH